MEKEAICILTKNKLSQEIVDSIISTNIAKIENTGVGYFLIIKNRLLPMNRLVLNKPILEANANGITTGLLIFIENQELTLKCHSWGDYTIEHDYRYQKVCISQK